MAKTKPEGSLKTFADFPAWREAHQVLQTLLEKKQSIRRALNPYGGTDDNMGALAATIVAAERAPANVKADLEKLRAEYPLLSQAVAEQEGVLERIEDECSQEICKGLVASYRENVRQTCRLLTELAILNAESMAMFHALSTNRISRPPELAQPPFPEIGILSDTESLVSRRLTELVKVGALTGQESEIKTMLALQGNRRR